MIHQTKDILKIDGRKVQTKEGTPLRWAQRAFGDVLHVGLGLGLVVDAIEARPSSSVRQIVIERNEEVIEAYSGTARVVRADFDELSADELGLFDCVLLDIPVTDERVAHAFSFTKDGGMIFVRR